MNTITKTNKVLNKSIILLVIFFSALILSSAASASQFIVSTNRMVVLDDPKSGSTGSGFFNPPHNWGTTDYWNGESTTIRAVTLLLDDNGLPLSGITVTFRAKNATGFTKNTALVTTDSKGMAYYSYNLNNNASWGYWKIEANTTIAGSNIQSNTSFASMWWGCAYCHNSENPGKWGTYTPKSYYTMGYDFHKSSDKSQHISPMTDGMCIVCHQMYNGTPVNWGDSPNSRPDNEYSPDWHKGKTKCQDCHAGSNLTKQSNTGQGKNPEIAGCYDTAGCHTKKNTNLTGVNSTTGYVVGGNYKTNYSDIQNSNVAKAHNASGTGVTCIVCHDAGHNITKPYNVSSTSNTYTENDQCWTCHTNRATTHYSNSNCASCHTQNAHRVSLGGGPNCISCHNATGSATHKIDENAMALGEHTNLNSGATIGTGMPVANKKCWGCHQTGGTQPAGMGDRYTNPYKCYDCHNATKPYANVNSAPTVNEHFKSGTDIQAAISATDNSTSCLTCHNVTEMKVSYTENDGLNNGSSLASHYGKNRSDLRVAGGSITDCRYCHQNTSTAFSGAMANTANNNMVNHSISPGTPACTECHGVGKIHDSPLNKPVSNDTLCKNCHIGKSEHKTLYCTECHANNSIGSLAGREIHGIKFLQKDNTFSQSRTNAVDCTTCHQLDVVDGSIGTTPLKISDQLHHSDDIINGSKWDNYWTGPIAACLYCHNDTRHDATPLGRPLIWNTSYVMGTTIGTGTNCADCHYKGDSNYNAMKLTFEAKALSIPPEITNGSWKGKPGYYNHTLSDYTDSYTDSQCRSCHDKAGSTNVGQLTHNVSIGISGGPDCKSCHDTGGIAPVHVNFSVSSGTDALHSGLNRDASSTVNVENKKCWACHGDGTQPTSGHPSNYRTPYTCENCHVQVQGSYNPSIIPTVDNHYWNGINITTTSVSSCQQCHNKTEMMLSVSGSEVVDNTNHYGKKRSDLGALSGANVYCEYCHNSTANGATFYVSDYNNSIVNHSVSSNTPLCANCHSTGRLHDSEIAKPVSSDTLCKTCHSGKSEHNNTLSCTECHANNSDGSLAGKDIHGIKFLQKDNTFSQDRVNSVDCTTCHQKNTVDSTIGIIPPKISDPLHHSGDTANGSKWGTYWTGANPITACQYCHNDTRHSATPLGRPLEWNPSYVIGTTIGTGTNCADCHYKGDSNYGAMNSAFTGDGLTIPPEITNGSWNGKPGYFNHTLGDYTDSRCKGCHYQGSSTVGQMLHDVSIGGGGTGCIECHNSISPSSSLTVDIDVFNNSIHQNINKSVPNGAVTNDDCWTCHYNQDMNRQNIRKCRDCHAKPQQWHGDANVDTNLTNLSIR